jgi:hypothetical protein
MIGMVNSIESITTKGAIQDFEEIKPGSIPGSAT